MQDNHPDDAREDAGTGTDDHEASGRRTPVADGGVQINEFVDAVADERRRYVLYYLRSEGDAHLEDLAEQVAAWENETPPRELDERTTKNVRIDLYHAHLPKLEEAGIIGYDSRDGAVRFRYLPGPIERFLKYCSAIEPPDEIEW